MAFKFLGQRQLGKLPSRWVSTILMVAIRKDTKANPHFPPQGIKSAGGTLSGQPEGGSGP